MATRGGWISLPLAVGVDRGHPQWPDLSLFFIGEGGGWRLLFAGGGRWWTMSGDVWVGSHLFG
jgi:hypothetical protein